MSEVLRRLPYRCTKAVRTIWPAAVPSDHANISLIPIKVFNWSAWYANGDSKYICVLLEPLKLNMENMRLANFTAQYRAS